jgi:membrane complex biogenesis BtpA family protein
MSARRAGYPRLIGVVHLPPLPGSPGASRLSPSDALGAAGLLAVKEAKQLVAAGFDGIILENFGDTPFFKDQVPTETVSAFSIIAAAVRESVKVPVGLNLLRNCALQVLPIAAVTDCRFMRVNVLSGVAATDQGIVEGRAADLLRLRDNLSADVAIFADVHVKHARSLSSDSVALAIEETAGRGGADAVIVSGATTGRSVSLDVLKEATPAAKKAGVPLYIGSGATTENVATLLRSVDGIIVSSALRAKGKAGATLDSARIKAFIKAAKRGKRA